MSVVTPREPVSPRRRRTTRDRPAAAQQATLATAWVRLELAAASGPGKRKAVNEDAHSVLTGAAPLFVVADGVGGGAMAAWASRQLVSRLHAALDGCPVDADSIRRALLLADRELRSEIAHLTSKSGAATVALCAGRRRLLSEWLIAWVGDCRIYRVGTRPGAPVQLLTRDDTYRHLSEPPPPGGSLDDPARMVGNGAVSAPNVAWVRLGHGEMLVLCSDGVHKHVAPDDMGRVLHEFPSLSRSCARLLELARSRGSGDDATVLVVQRYEPWRTRIGRLVALGTLGVVLAGLVVAWSDVPLWPQSAPATARPSDTQVQTEAERP